MRRGGALSAGVVLTQSGAVKKCSADVDWNFRPSPLWGRGWLATGVLISRGETGEGVRTVRPGWILAKSTFPSVIGDELRTYKTGPRYSPLKS
jgi:hypothetical protein